jgi:hypothetical protein
MDASTKDTILDYTIMIGLTLFTALVVTAWGCKVLYRKIFKEKRTI